MTSLRAHGGSHWKRSSLPLHCSSVGRTSSHCASHSSGQGKSRAYRFWNSWSDNRALSANLRSVKDRSLPVLQLRMGMFFLVLNSMSLSMPKPGCSPLRGFPRGHDSSLSKSAMTKGMPDCSLVWSHWENAIGLPSQSCSV
jgi:hypothetical protein